MPLKVPVLSDVVNLEGFDTLTTTEIVSYQIKIQVC